MTVLGALIKSRVVQDQELWGAWARGDDLDPVMLSGQKVTRESAMRLSAVWACVSLISDSISTLPLGAFTRTAENVREPLGPPPSWIDEPNREQSRPQWVQQQLLALLLDGTAYVFTARNRRGDVVEAWNVPPQMVTPRRIGGQVVYDVTDPRVAKGGQTRFDGRDMFHVPAMSWPGQIKGMSPLEAARHMLGAGLGAQEFAERFYGQGMSQAGVVQVPGDLTVEQAKQLKSDFARRNSGTRNAHLPAVLTGDAKWQPTSINPEQAQFLEARQFTTVEIARFFRCPPHLISDVERSTSWGTGIEQQAIGFVTYTLRPWLDRLERAYTRHLLAGRNGFIKFNVDGLLRGDFQTRQAGYATGRQWGWLSANDVRALEDLPPLPDGGDEYMVPVNMRPAGTPPPLVAEEEGAASA